MKDIAIETKLLCKKYDKQMVVSNVSIKVKRGQIYGLLGRNGAGKTTIMKMLLGLAEITSGEASIMGHPVKRNSNVYAKVGNIIESPAFYHNLSGYENLRVFAKLKGTVNENMIKNAMQFVNLPYQDKKSFSNYSLGMKQRLGIANAMMNNPDILILDEPSNGLDPIGIAEIRELLKNLSATEGKTIFISSHQLSEIELLANTIGILHNGVLLEECDIHDFSKNSESLEEHFKKITGGFGIA